MPAGSRGKTRDEFVLNVDLAPTFLTAAGLSIPKKMQGRDFSPLYLNAETAPSPAWRDEFFCEHATISKKERIPSSEAVVRKDLKYTLWPEWNFEELYDLTEDPLEQKNLVHSPEYAGKLAELKKLLKSMRKEAR